MSMRNEKGKGSDMAVNSSGQHADAPSSNPLKTVISIILMVAAVALITVALRLFVFVPYEIPSGSMEETIMTGDMIFSEKISYYFRSPERGDIVTFDDPEVPGRTLIKRVIAGAGDWVNIETPVIMAGSPPPPYGGGGGGSADSRELDIFDEE